MPSSPEWLEQRNSIGLWEFFISITFSSARRDQYLPTRSCRPLPERDYQPPISIGPRVALSLKPKICQSVRAHRWTIWSLALTVGCRDRDASRDKPARGLISRWCPSTFLLAFSVSNVLVS